MKATPFEFRFRFAIHFVLFLLGFVAPWNYALHLDRAHSTWEWLASVLAQTGALRMEAAFNTLLVLAIVFAALGALLRIWGSAYLGSSVVQSFRMHGAGVVADGPYRHQRNPLYLGLWLHAFALALIMPPSGAVFAIVTIGYFQLRLIFAEETFLTAKLGQSYLDYCARVPRLLFSALPRVPASDAQAHWGQAMLSEIYMIGAVISFAVLGWRYSGFLLTRGILISLGVSIVVRALMPRNAPQTA